jgi:hypothetical protein
MKSIRLGIILLLVVLTSTGLSFGQLQQQQQASQNQTISDAEFDLFINAFNEIQSINSAAQQKMIKILADNNLDVQRYNEIQQARQTGDNSLTLTAEETENIGKAETGISEIQVETQQEMEKKIEAVGITLTRYQEISMQIQQDEALMEKFQNKIGK